MTSTTWSAFRAYGVRRMTGVQGRALMARAPYAGFTNFAVSLAFVKHQSHLMAALPPTGAANSVIIPSPDTRTLRWRRCRCIIQLTGASQLRPYAPEAHFSILQDFRQHQGHHFCAACGAGRLETLHIPTSHVSCCSAAPHFRFQANLGVFNISISRGFTCSPRHGGRPLLPSPAVLPAENC